MCIRDRTAHIVHHESELSHLESGDRLRMQKLIKEFSTVLTPKLGLTNLIEYKINLSDHKVIRLPPYKLSPPKMEVMRNHINKLLEQGVIEPSTSPYSSPSFLVPKSHDKHRLVVDYRQLNKRIEFESCLLYTSLYVNLCGILCLTHFHLMLFGAFLRNHTASIPIIIVFLF